MNNKKLKLILIISIVVLGVGFLFAQSAKAVDSWIVEFEKTPSLFSEMDIKPCDVTQRWIKVTNYSGEVLDALIRATNFTSPIPDDDLSRVLEITIKRGTDNLYGPKTLTEFYQTGGVILGNIPDDTMVQYDIIISISCDEGNEWQEKTTGFDIEINGSGDNTPRGIGGGEDIFSANITTGGGTTSGPPTEYSAGEVAGITTERLGEVLGESTTLPETGGSFRFMNTGKNVVGEESLPYWVFAFGLIPVFLALYLNLKRAKIRMDKN